MFTLYEPSIEDLWFRAQMMGNEQTMAYNHAYGGAIPFPKEHWTDWYDRWLADHDDKRFYRYVKVDDMFVGEVAYYFEEERQITLASVIMDAPYRGKGYGSKALMLLCQAAKEANIHELYDDIAIDNPSAALFLKCGFSVILQTEEYILLKKEL